MPTGTATIDFGAFPGKSDGSIVVIGQAAILAGSFVEAWLRPVVTADHSADEHMVETLKVVAGDIVAATGFTIYGFNTNQIHEPDEPKFSGGRGTRIYGLWTIAWAWV